LQLLKFQNWSSVVNSRVVVLDENKVVLDKQLSNDRGEVLFNVECQKDILLKYIRMVLFQIKHLLLKLQWNGYCRCLLGRLTETEIILKPIYFENNRSGITEQAAEELDKQAIEKFDYLR
jgi:hypothetical protein